jgi:hypothetical protein
MLLLQRQLSDLVYPIVERIPDAPAYLVVLTPSTESLSWSKGLRWIWNLGMVTLTLFLINKIVLKTMGQSLITLILSVF